MDPYVAVIVVTWNKKEYVLKLINALQAIDYDSYDVIVVDNASTDGSAEEIAKKYPYVQIIVNSENTGGTGGFNTGIRHALQKGNYEYLWLLDNDAMIEHDTLKELVGVAEKDRSIAVCGSMILNPDREGIVTELGAYISWEQGTWIPNMRNAPISDKQIPHHVDVDYVAACSALIRAEVLLKVGIMDARYFLHWDDIDLCLRIKKAGYRVVAVSNSKVFHAVEKYMNPVLIYYDMRNGLLSISKHTSSLEKMRYIMNMLRRAAKGYIYSSWCGLRGNAYLLRKGVQDFIAGRFYRLNAPIDLKIENTIESREMRWDDLATRRPIRVLVLPNGTTHEIMEVIKEIRHREPKCHVTLMIQSDRYRLFREAAVDEFIEFHGYRQSSLQTMMIMMKVLINRYDYAISPTMTTLPYSYSTRNYALYDQKSAKLYKSRENIFRAWKLPIIVLLSEMIAAIMLPIAMWASRRYGLNGAARLSAD